MKRTFPCTIPGCTKSRPRCAYHRQQNAKWKTCRCSGYPFPHRIGSGACEHSTDSAKKQWEYYTGTSWENGETK